MNPSNFQYQAGYGQQQPRYAGPGPAAGRPAAGSGLRPPSATGSRLARPAGTGKSTNRLFKICTCVNRREFLWLIWFELGNWARITVIFVFCRHSPTRVPSPCAAGDTHALWGAGDPEAFHRFEVELCHARRPELDGRVLLTKITRMMEIARWFWAIIRLPVILPTTPNKWFSRLLDFPVSTTAVLW